MALSCHAASAGEVKVQTDNLEALKGAKKVVISNFVVEYQKRYESVKKGFSLLGLGNAGVSVTSNENLLPEPVVLKSITNYLHDVVVAQLKAKGYEVVEPANMAVKANYGKYADGSGLADGASFLNMDGESVLYSPDGFKAMVPLVGGCSHYVTKDTSMGTRLKLASAQMAAGQAMEQERQIMLAESAPALKVWLTVGFGDASAAGGNALIMDRQKSYWGNTVDQKVLNSANGKASAGMFMKPAVTRISIRTNSELAAVKGCGVSFSASTVLPPVDGEVQIQLQEKHVDDGGPVAALQSQAASIAVQSKLIGSNLVQTTVKESSDGTKDGSSAGAAGAKVTLQSNTTSGRIDTAGYGTSLRTQASYVTEFGADVYATSAVKMMQETLSALISRLP